LDVGVGVGEAEGLTAPPPPPGRPPPPPPGSDGVALCVGVTAGVCVGVCDGAVLSGFITNYLLAIPINYQSTVFYCGVGSFPGAFRYS